MHWVTLDKGKTLECELVNRVEKLEMLDTDVECTVANGVEDTMMLLAFKVAFGITLFFKNVVGVVTGVFIDTVSWVHEAVAEYLKVDEEITVPLVCTVDPLALVKITCSGSDLHGFKLAPSFCSKFTKSGLEMVIGGCFPGYGGGGVL